VAVCEGWGGPHTITAAQLASLVVAIFPDGVVPQTGERIRVTAYAVAKAESGRNPWACGDELQSVGLWQIYTPAHPQYDYDSLFDSGYNANAALEISQGGANWNAWCTWEETACGGHGTGSYRNHLDEARQALGDVVIPPPGAGLGVAPALLGLSLVGAAAALYIWKREEHDV